MTTNPIARLDVPVDVVEANVARIAQQKQKQKQKQPAPELAPAGLVAEYRHLLYDADPDATVPAFIDLRHHATRRGTR